MQEAFGKNLMDLISRQKAIELGQSWYFTGDGCHQGHIAKRNVRSCVCYECRKILDKKYRAARPELFKERDAKSHKKCRDKLIQTRPWKVAISNIKTRAKRRGLEYDLDEAWAKQRWTGKCELTGLSFQPSTRNGPQPFGVSVDRIDNSKGYTKNNCRFILCALNMLKSDGTDEDCITIAKAFLEKHNV